MDSKESIPPAYVAWLAGTSNKVFVPARQAGNRFLGSLKAFQISGSILCTDEAGTEQTGIVGQ
jgi:hypothetical protein